MQARRPALPRYPRADAAIDSEDDDEVVDAELVEADENTELDVSANPQDLEDDDTQIIPIIRAYRRSFPHNLPAFANRCAILRRDGA